MKNSKNLVHSIWTLLELVMNFTSLLQNLEKRLKKTSKTLLNAKCTRCTAPRGAEARSHSKSEPTRHRHREEAAL